MPMLKHPLAGWKCKPEQEGMEKLVHGDEDQGSEDDFFTVGYDR